MENKDLEKIQQEMLEETSYAKLSDFYSLFADRTRLAIIALLTEYDLCVNDIAEIMGMSQSRISHQLAVLRDHDIVTYYRKGKQVVYGLTDNHIKDLFKTGLEHVSEKDEELYRDRRAKNK